MGCELESSGEKGGADDDADVLVTLLPLSPNFLFLKTLMHHNILRKVFPHLCSSQVNSWKHS